MREIKFRAHCKPDNRFYYFTIGQGSAVFNDRDIYNQLCIDGVAFEQFTGLHDKNGKEIYEGDKFCLGGIIMFVSWNEGSACFILTTGCEYGTINYINLDCDVVYQKEIIGNIHENRERMNSRIPGIIGPKEDKTV